MTLAAFAVTGMPPFGAFVSEISILTKSADLGSWGVVWSLVIALGVTFVAVSTHVGRILFGGPKPNFKLFKPVRASLVPGLLMLGSLLLGIMARPNFWMVLK